ncbi:MAG: pyruvoyl-dependent arginine decarboxylase [Desulfobacterales bacterium]|nr:pyruvoyl-dependent arginine decarboxylase [Desulfobacterales bacterium]
MSSDELKGSIEILDYSSAWVVQVLPALAAAAHPRPPDLVPRQEHRGQAAELRQLQRRLPVQGRPGELRRRLQGRHPGQGHPARRHERPHRPEEQPRRRGQEPGRHPRQSAVETGLRPALRHLQGLDARPPRRLRRLPRHRLQGAGTGRAEEVKMGHARPFQGLPGPRPSAGTRRSSSASRRPCARPASPPSTSSGSRASSRRAPSFVSEGGGPRRSSSPGQILFVVLSENATDEPGRLHLGLDRRRRPRRSRRTTATWPSTRTSARRRRRPSIHTEYLAAEMLATKLGHKLKEPGRRPPRSFRISNGLSLKTRSATQTATGEAGVVDDGHRGRRVDHRE